ncbi:hypothetical protein B566_EDAN000910 [Ephemera danica]|nr:hypothetical protein B566_EDAN000910 [Ephemera danica]
MPRLLTTSASACRKLIRKAELMGVDCQALETQEAQVASLIDVRKKWHIPPAFSVEFIGYYLDRNIRIAGMKRHLEDSLKTNNQLLKKQQSLRCRYDQLVKDRKEMQQQIDAELASVRSLRQTILAICPSQQLPPEPCMAPPPAPAPVVVAPTVYTPHPVPARRESKHHRQEALTLNECGICRQTKDQHLLAKCDTCHRFYHLGCLNPPLTRMPKKTKLMGWQCSECDKETSGSEPECPDPEAPRKLRYSQGDAPVPTYRHFDPSDPCPQLQRQPMVALTPLDFTATVPALVLQASRLLENAKGSGKRRHKHQHRLGPNGEKHKRRRKKKHMADQPRIKITIKPILPPSDQAPGSSQQMFVASQPTVCLTPLVVSSTSSTPVATPSPAKPRARRPSNRPEPDVMTQCDTCQTPGTNQNLVRCDECRKCFHFHCLEPPVKKSPKRRGYSWHCADCDPTDSDHSNKH